MRLLVLVLVLLHSNIFASDLIGTWYGNFEVDSIGIDGLIKGDLRGSIEISQEGEFLEISDCVSHGILSSNDVCLETIFVVRDGSLYILDENGESSIWSGSITPNRIEYTTDEFGIYGEIEVTGEDVSATLVDGSSDVFRYTRSSKKMSKKKLPPKLIFKNTYKF